MWLAEEEGNSDAEALGEDGGIVRETIFRGVVVVAGAAAVYAGVGVGFEADDEEGMDLAVLLRCRRR